MKRKGKPEERGKRRTGARKVPVKKKERVRAGAGRGAASGRHEAAPRSPDRVGAPPEGRARAREERPPESIVVAIDGPVGSGKSTIARELAKRLGFLHLNTGMMYRLLAAAALEQGTPLDESALASLAGRIKIGLDSEGVRLLNVQLTQDINSPVIAETASRIATLARVRRALVSVQQDLVRCRSVVAEGRDTTTIVFPKATLKVYLTAREEVRARRRQKQLREVGVQATYEEVLAWLRKRDKRDSTREHAPLKKAKGAVVVDTSDKSAQEIVAGIARRLKGD